MASRLLGDDEELPLSVRVRLVCGFALATVLAGCTRRECTAYAPGNLTSEQSARLASAAARWNALAGREVIRWDDGDPNACAVSAVYGLQGEGLAEESDVLGSWSERKGELVLYPDHMRATVDACAEHSDDCLEATALHEFGHALGLEHVDADAVMMARQTRPQLEFAGADRGECRRAGVCR